VGGGADAKSEVPSPRRRSISSSSSVYSNPPRALVSHPSLVRPYLRMEGLETWYEYEFLPKKGSGDLKNVYGIWESKGWGEETVVRRFMDAGWSETQSRLKYIRAKLAYLEKKKMEEEKEVEIAVKETMRVWGEWREDADVAELRVRLSRWGRTSNTAASRSRSRSRSPVGKKVYRSAARLALLCKCLCFFFIISNLAKKKPVLTKVVKTFIDEDGHEVVDLSECCDLCGGDETQCFCFVKPLY